MQQTYTGSIIVPSQIRNFRDAGSAVAEAKEKFAKCLPPLQYIPHDVRGDFHATLDVVIDLVYVLEPNLHKVYLLVDQEKLEEMIGIIKYSQIQKQMCDVRPPEEPQYIMNYDDAIQSLRILTGIVRVVSAAIAWTNSEDGARFRRDMNHAHAAMEASFDRWLRAVLPEDVMALPSDEPPSLQCPDEPLSPLLFSNPIQTNPRRPKSLPKLQIKPPSEVPFFTSEASPYPVLTPPPLSPLCRYKHTDASMTTCRFCCSIPRQPIRPRMSQLSSFLLGHSQEDDQTVPHKRAQRSYSPSEFDSLFLTGDPVEDTDTIQVMRPSDYFTVADPPSSTLSLRSLSSGDSSGDSLSPISDHSELELRPLISLPGRRRRNDQPTKPSGGKQSFWRRLLREFLPFLRK